MPASATLAVWLTAVLVATIGSLSAAQGAQAEQIRARGKINGHVIDTTVDSFQAKYYLEDYLSRSGSDPALEQALDRRLSRLPRDRIIREDFRELSQAYSVDLATMHLVRLLSEAPGNARLQRSYWRESEELRRVTANDQARLRLCRVAADLPLVLFVPGWFYQSDSDAGGDMAAPRALLTALGVRNELIRTLENGTVDENARLVAEHIRRASRVGETIVLVSASKGGPEAAHALGHLLGRGESAAVKAWINIGGILKGSPLADWASRWPNRWLVWLVMSLQGRRIDDSLASMTTTRSIDRWLQESIPDHIKVVNFVGVPLSGHISDDADFGYARTKHAGPTDGLTALIDEMAHGGATILEIGLDHYYRDPEIDLKTVALGLTVMRAIGNPVSYDCPSR